ncbi:MAG: tetratricopeptide repeat protein, partial [Planctomycetes bacterium]|nr:tetratricopeptide repeat protein [Planctomycetota bacterium]
MPDVQQAKTQAMVFYSFKGGVGRSMALANAAVQLAIKHGKDVIAVDFDLEAPGLHHYFGYQDADLAQRVGLLDYLQDYVCCLDNEGRSSPRIQDYLVPPAAPIHGLVEARTKEGGGSLRLLHCGRTNADFMARVQEFGWRTFFHDRHGYEIIRALRRQLCAAADVVLIDARAGQTEVGATPTVLMADAVVLLFTSNAQNLHGTEEMVRRLHHHPARVAQALGEPRFLLVPSRVFPLEPSFKEWMAKEASPMFQRLCEGESPPVSKLDQPGGLEQCILAVDPAVSVNERIVMLEPAQASAYRSALQPAYEELAGALVNLHEGRTAWSARTSAEPNATEPQRIQELRDRLFRAAKRGDQDEVAALQFDTARELTDVGSHAEAWTLLEASLAHNAGPSRERAHGAILHEMGRLRAAQEQWPEALALYEQALTLEREAGDKQGQGVTLHQMGRVRAAQEQWQEALALYEQSLALRREEGEKRGQGITLLEMGRVRAAQEQWPEALALYEQSLALERELGDKRAQCVTLHEIGTVRAAQDQWREALARY